MNTIKQTKTRKGLQGTLTVWWEVLLNLSTKFSYRCPIVLRLGEMLVHCRFFTLEECIESMSCWKNKMLNAVNKKRVTSSYICITVYVWIHDTSNKAQILHTFSILTSLNKNLILPLNLTVWAWHFIAAFCGTTSTTDLILRPRIPRQIYFVNMDFLH